MSTTRAMHINVTVKADSPRDSVSFERGRYRVSVRVPTRDGQANDAARKLLAEAFGVPIGSLTLVKGARQPSKIFLLRE